MPFDFFFRFMQSFFEDYFKAVNPYNPSVSVFCLFYCNKLLNFCHECCHLSTFGTFDAKLIHNQSPDLKIKAQTGGVPLTRIFN